MLALRFLPLVLFVAVLAFAETALRCGLHAACSLYLQMNPLMSSVLRPTSVFTTYAIAGTLPILFAKTRFFIPWSKFAVPWVLISVFFVASTQISEHALFTLFTFVRTDAARLAGIGFSIASFISVALSYFLPEKTPRKR